MTSRSNNEMNMKGVFASFLVLSIFLFQGCTSVKVKTFVKTKEDSGSERNLLPEINGKAPTALSEIPDGDICRLDLTHPKCLGRQLTQACPAQPFIDAVPPVGQETGVWCWAATGVSFFLAHGFDKRQCEILNEVQGLSIDCCKSENETNPLCLKNGWPHQAFDNSRTSQRFDFKFFYGPLPINKLIHVLCEYGPVAFVIRAHGGGGHSFVVKNIVFEDNAEWVLVQDHSSVVDAQGNRAPAEFKQWSYDAFEEGLWLSFNRTNSDHFVDYFEVKPLR